ncbi:hypothetical protein LVD15_21550 [Fulvivirga maritima]|uniref:hypothetical protein n=1 Tax=Fulvivirga maritima TaxID=2904247 RepID=UPI001F304ACE|nr:hypothetical protein [Fulvivirga maritima]UII25859.1 hypothetical protein LVD15_21550 [Fulvivirga maritima]
MKLIIIRNFCFSVIAMLLIIGCESSNKSEEKDQSETTISSTPINVDTPESQSQEYYINSKENISLATINIQDSDITLHIGDQTLFGELKRSDKRKYYDQADQHHYSVKYKSSEGFKLRNSDEELLWKVKIKDSKISIANNEEMNEAFDIRLYDDERIKVKKGEEELNAIRFDRNDEFLKVDNQYFLRNFKHSMASGVLMISGMSETEKFIICAEILKLNK